MLTDKVNELVSAIGELNNGASEVRDGTGKLYDATGTLNGKVGEMHTGVGSLTDGAGDLYSGLSSITAKNDQLTGAAYTAYEGLCTAAATALNSQLEANGMDPVTLTPSTYSAVLMGLLEKMNADAVYQQAYQAALQQVTKQVSELKGQLDNYGAFYQGLLEYTGAVSDTAAGAKVLKLNMDTQIRDEIDAMISSVSGSDAEVVSFVSDKNTNVDSVQFVIKTAAIEKAETTVSDAVEEAPLTFWQKLLRLFGLY